MIIYIEIYTEGIVSMTGNIEAPMMQKKLCDSGIKRKSCNAKNAETEKPSGRLKTSPTHFKQKPRKECSCKIWRQ